MLRPTQLLSLLALFHLAENGSHGLQQSRPLPSATSANVSNSRREAMEKVARGGAFLAFSAPFAAASPPAQPASAMYENAPVRSDSSPGPTSLPSGISYEDLRPGPEGAEVVVPGKRVNVQWVLKRSNGYFVDSSERNDGVPFIFTVGDPGGAIAGLDEGIRGMRVGGIRRIIVPPNLAYVEGVEDGKPGPVPAGFGPKQRMRRVMELLKDIPGEVIVLDVKATRVQ